MKIKIKTLEVFGEPTYKARFSGSGELAAEAVKYVDEFGIPRVRYELHIYPKGTKRKVRVLNIPSFRITEEIQVADIEFISGSDGCMEYNRWIYL